jgi:Ankyrin repeats (many copies)
LLMRSELKPADSSLAQFINAVIEHFPSCVESRYGRSSITPLHLAAAYGNVTAVKVLLHRGASPFVKDGTGRTPIEGIEDDDGEVWDIHGNVVVGIVRQRSLRRWRDTRQVLRRAMDPSDGSPQ